LGISLEKGPRQDMGSATARARVVHRLPQRSPCDSNLCVACELATACALGLVEF
jgi:hypothetical protein